ncbi:MAG: hypothetical protein ABI874_06855 [Chloroflexota bacterium]
MFRVIAYDSNTRPPPCVVQKDGEGIAYVEFHFNRKTTAGEVEVYARTESNAPYCAFQDTDGKCNVWVLVDHGNTWPNNTAITNGDYVLRIRVRGKDGNTRNGALNFTIKVP